MPLADLIREEIAATGPISLARFMALALYHPDHGYYAQPDRPIGRRGDFLTSVSVGPMFGRLLARRFAGWLDGLGPGPLQVLEAGAHSGQLAADVWSAFAESHPTLARRLTYTILEPLPHRRSQQATTLDRWRERVRWSADWTEVPSPVRGVVLGNELLDAMPVHRWLWDAGRRVWRESGVGVCRGDFIWAARDDAATRAAPPTLPDELRAALPDGYVTETSPAAVAWWTAAAQHLERGWLVAIDYGDDDEARWGPGRTNGTFRGYRAHQATPDPLADPGSQDLTAHVDFATLRRAGELAGLRTESLQSQERFLADILKELLPGDDFAATWTSAERRQVTTLLHPQHLGRAFQVLVQSR